MRALQLIKCIHTLVWAVVAGCIFALFAAVAHDEPSVFGWLHVVIGAEIATLLAFRGKCPLTYLAERYTDDRAPNFDIYLPRAVARWNKEIFTAILVLAWALSVWRWLFHSASS